jgi:Ca2+-binding EF-hand superfamily protein
MRMFVLTAVLLAPALAAAQTLPRDGNAPAYGTQQSRQAPMMGMRGMDADNDGAISREEFMAGYENDDVRFAAIDVDKDGAVSREEYLAAGRQNRDQRFKALDGNGDGRLTREELDARRSAMFETMDADKDGRITAPEMRRNAHRVMPPQQSELPR